VAFGIGRQHWQAALAGSFGRQLWQAALAGSFGRQLWQVALASNISRQHWQAAHIIFKCLYSAEQHFACCPKQRRVVRSEAHVSRPVCYTHTFYETALGYFHKFCLLCCYLGSCVCLRM
jgi:hypothetical protein